MPISARAVPPPRTVVCSATRRREAARSSARPMTTSRRPIVFTSQMSVFGPVTAWKEAMATSGHSPLAR